MIDRLNILCKYYLLIVVFVLLSLEVVAQREKNNTITGNIIDSKHKAIPFATVWINGINKGGVSNAKGQFTIKAIPVGVYDIEVNCLGYKELHLKIEIKKGENRQQFVLKERSFALKDVVVTAKKNKSSGTTSYDIKSDAIEHTQATTLSSIMSLLPGGQTISGNLLNQRRKRITLRSEQYETDNPDFGTAIEVDGIRIGNNASFEGRANGGDIRIISPNNIEKVEVVTGVPSVEYGDLTSGLVKVITKQGVMPLSLKLAVTPRQKQISATKGIRLGKTGGVLNMSYDYTRAISNKYLLKVAICH